MSKLRTEPKRSKRLKARQDGWIETKTNKANGLTDKQRLTFGKLPGSTKGH